ncbi:hypothetical protein IW262DRAFT_1235198, partial [Armillaria fumosa]
KSTVALKTSRVSLKVQRPILRHEARILQLLKRASCCSLGVCVRLAGAFRVHGYGYSGAEQQNNDGLGLMLTTVVQIAGQMQAELEHIRSPGIVHRDVKPENLLCALDASTIKFINFTISKPFSHGQLSKYKPFKDRR